MQQLVLISDLSPSGQDWTFNGAPTRELTHCYHDYPARMIPQVAGRLIDQFAPANARLLFDPYSGTGTSLVEGLIRGINGVGTDLNPLARLIARAKTSTPDLKEVDREIARFNRIVLSSKLKRLAEAPEIQGISNLEFWFKPAVISNLRRLKLYVDEISDDEVRLFFQVAFSETVRESSNTRNEEFKLYRYDAAKLEKFNPDVFEIMASKLKRNRAGLQKFLAIMNNFKHVPTAVFYDFNSVEQVPHDKVSLESVDLVLTSPPYGDSHTTVAYGQYSRLSAAWLGLPEPDKIDSKLMGGKTYRAIPDFECAPLDHAVDTVRKIDEKRAHEVAAFYTDLRKSISNVAEVVKPGGYACYVVGNRKVKGVVLPTDKAIHSFFESCGFDYVDTFHRSIPNKRMPLRNSPTNAPGAVDQTMIQEYIVVMRRKIPRAIRETRQRIAKRKSSSAR